MGKIAFVFSGQGAQAPGMGHELYEKSPAARAIFDRAEEIRPGTLRQCFEGTAAELQETCNTQPCMFAVELAAAAALREAGICADMAAGFSLGEIAALTWTGVADFDTGFRLVCRRGELMQQAAEQQDTAMAAVLKLPEAEVERICADIPGMYPVNYNCPQQVAVAGPREAMSDLSAAVRAAGGRAVPLKVRGGFHSPYMQTAAEEFRRVLQETELKMPQVPLYSNLTGRPYCADDDFVEMLSQQIMNPVRWETIVRGMIAAGADTFIECGPGKTLCGLINKTDKLVKTWPMQSTENLEGILAEVNGNG